MSAVLAVLAIGAGVLTLTPARRLFAGDPSQGVAAVSSPVAPASGAPASAALPSAAPSASASPSASAGPAVTASATKSRDAGPIVAPTLSRTPPAALCRDGDVKITITAQGDDPTAPGPQLGLVSIENDSSGPCRVDGRIFVGLYNAADERVQVPASSVNEPGKAADILLRPGTGAFQGIKWQACDRADEDCPTGNTLRGSFNSTSRGVVAELEEFPDPNRSLITMASLKLGTLQPSTEGVVAW